MSVVIFIKSFIEAVGTPTTSFFYDPPLTTRPVFFLLSHPYHQPFCYICSATNHFLLSALYNQLFSSYGLCYWPFPTTGPLSPASFFFFSLQTQLATVSTSSNFPFGPCYHSFLLPRLNCLPILLPTSNY